MALFHCSSALPFARRDAGRRISDQTPTQHSHPKRARCWAEFLMELLEDARKLLKSFIPELEGNAGVINWCCSEAAAKSILIRNGAARECSPATCALLSIYNWCVTFAALSPGWEDCVKGYAKHTADERQMLPLLCTLTVSMYFIQSGGDSWSWPSSKGLHI